jgi:predicted HTH domain antitoxin
MSQPLTIDMDDEVLLGMNKSPEEMAREIRLAAAVKWYELGTISQGKAAQMAGLSRAEFITALSRFGVSPMQETADEILNAVTESRK